MAQEVDFEERKKNQDALKISEERLRIALDATQTGIWDWDLEHDIWYASPIYYTMLGYEPEYGMSDRKLWMSRVHPEDQPVIEEKIKNILNKETRNYNYEARMLHANGNYRWHRVIGYIVEYNAQGKPKRLVGIRQDIDELKKSVENLSKSENQLKTLINTIPDLIWVKNFDGIFLHCNSQVGKLYGTTIEGIVGKTDYDFIDKEKADFFRKKDMEAIATGKPCTNEEDIIYPDGHIEIMETIKTPIYNDDNSLLGVLGIGRLITERKKSEQELEKYREHLEFLVQERTEELEASNEELQAINEELYVQKEELQKTLNALNIAKDKLIHSEKMASLGILSAGIAHEINNPLNFIHGGQVSLEMILKEKLNDELNEIKPYLDAINTGVVRASEIVTSLSHYCRQDNLPKSECDIHKIIDNCLIMLNNQIKGKIKVTKFYTEVPHKIMGSEGKLHQAILNIISNSEQAIDNSGTILIETIVEQAHLIISISDNGTGINSEDLKKIFDPFFTTKAPGKGTGLGLSITYNIIREHNGSIEYESEEGKGTKAIIKLPILN
jgi:PAS domain S-box-containing protein